MTSSMTVVSEVAVPAQSRNYAHATDTQPSRKRGNHRNRKNAESYTHHQDGTVSDGALVQPTTSPHPRQPTRHRQHAPAESPHRTQAVNPNRSNAHKRTASVGDGLVPATPSKEPASSAHTYAGGVFSASPAPSSLPVPKFLPRSVPAARVTSLPPETATDGNSATKERNLSPSLKSPSPAQSPTHRSSMPLDLLFEADRNERRRNRSSSNTFSPEMALRSLQLNAGLQSPSQNTRKAFLEEVHEQGETDVPHTHDSPVDRILPRSSPSPTANRLASNEAGMAEERQAQTRSLKDLLFIAASPPTHPAPQGHSTNGAFVPRTPDSANQPPSLQRSIPGPSTPDQRNAQYPHYYGNRNLSGLFEATRGETPPRPSALRQEIGSKDPRSMASANAYPASLPSAGQQPNPNQWAKTYLNEQIQSSSTSGLPHFCFNQRSASGGLPPRDYTNQHASLSTGAGMPGPSGLQEPARNSGAYDVQTIESDLRRMLRLNS